MTRQKTLLGLSALAIGAFWTLLVSQVLVSSMPYNPLSNSGLANLNLRGLIPEGWAFFTRSPREEQYYLYRMENGRPVCLNRTNAHYSNWFGLSRAMRANSMELGTMIEKIPKSDWTESPAGFHDTDLSCLAPVPVVNTALLPAYQGEYIVTSKEPIPWAWSKSCNPETVPCKIVKIKVLCVHQPG